MVEGKKKSVSAVEMIFLVSVVISSRGFLLLTLSTQCSLFSSTLLSIRWWRLNDEMLAEREVDRFGTVLGHHLPNGLSSDFYLLFSLSAVVAVVDVSSDTVVDCIGQSTHSVV